MTMSPRRRDPLAEAARRAAEREAESARHPEPSLGARLGQIGVLGWTIVDADSGRTAVGRWLDKALAAASCSPPR